MDQLNVGKCDPWPADGDKRKHRLIPFKWYEYYEICYFWCQSIHCGPWSRKSVAYRLFPPGTCIIFRATGCNCVLGLGSCASAPLSVSPSSGALDWTPKIRSIEWLRKTCAGFGLDGCLRSGLMVKVAVLAMTHKPEQMIATKSGKYRSIDALQSRLTGGRSGSKQKICDLLELKSLLDKISKRSVWAKLGDRMSWNGSPLAIYTISSVWLFRAEQMYERSVLAEPRTSSLSPCTCKWRQWWYCKGWEDYCSLRSTHCFGSCVH